MSIPRHKIIVDRCSRMAPNDAITFGVYHKIARNMVQQAEDTPLSTPEKCFENWLRVANLVGTMMELKSWKDPRNAAARQQVLSYFTLADEKGRAAKKLLLDLDARQPLLAPVPEPPVASSVCSPSPLPSLSRPSPSVPAPIQPAPYPALPPLHQGPPVQPPVAAPLSPVNINTGPTRIPPVFSPPSAPAALRPPPASSARSPASTPPRPAEHPAAVPMTCAPSSYTAPSVAHVTLPPCDSFASAPPPPLAPACIGPGAAWAPARAPALPGLATTSGLPEVVPLPADPSLRPVTIPRALFAAFLRAAAANTARGVETCGILAGPVAQLQSTAPGTVLHVTSILVPPQTGSPDSCTASGEVEIDERLSALQLGIMGWIHTHPTQTAFLSSVDLHTHLVYQLCLDEAVAVVLSPTKAPSSVFSAALSIVLRREQVFALSPFGRTVLTSCTKTGFHVHETDPARGPLYGLAPHVRVVDGPADGELAQLIDMRH